MENLKVKAVGDKVLIKPLDVQEVEQFGLIIPKEHQEAVPRGIIVSKGDKVSDAIKVGDEVVHGPYRDASVVIGETNYYLMREADIFAIM